MSSAMAVLEPEGLGLIQLQPGVAGEDVGVDLQDAAVLPRARRSSASAAARYSAV